MQNIYLFLSIIKMIETGYIDQIQRKHKKNYKITGYTCIKTSEDDGDGVKAFGIYKVVPLFTLLSIGLLTSTLSYGFEIVIHKLNPWSAARQVAKK